MIHLDTKAIGKVDMKTFMEKVEENNKVHVSIKGILSEQATKYTYVFR